MTGIQNLDKLLAKMSPFLSEEAYVFITQRDSAYGDMAELTPLGSFVEIEGLSLIIPKSKADDAGLIYEGVYRAITLKVHSSLSAVGLTAAVAENLADLNISANVVAAFHHDHIFVPTDRAEEAIAALRALQQSHP